ncbi:MAG TPA: heavy metal translocating P-type ATPase [Anaerovoracaceae bacterium]|nr:heavy metal translocating P-type ATPase [Anaerovoracaceae bacterium]
MNYTIVHEIPGRIRFSFDQDGFTPAETDALYYILAEQPFVRQTHLYRLSGSLLVYYQKGFRAEVIRAVAALSRRELGNYILPDGVFIPQHYADQYLIKIAFMATQRIISRIYLPAPLRIAFIVKNALPFIFKGLKSLFGERELNVEVLDATAIGVSVATRNFSTASNIVFLLSVGTLLEEWTHKKSRQDLAQSLALRISSVWVKRDGEEMQAHLKDLSVGDLVVVRMGGCIPVDGTVVEGEAMVNQASMTGEAMPIRRLYGDSVYAGTVLEEGSLVIRTNALSSETKLNKIIQLIDESEAFKAAVQSRIEHMADSIVPYNFLLAGAVYWVSRNLLTASTALMVDYSCALKMSAPIAVLAAMREGTQRGLVIKGGKFLEEVAAADTIVFDKTGTLTEARPKVVDVIPYGGYNRIEVLRLAACLEEHFPHSVATAVVAQAQQEGIEHREMHTKIEYVVAHGIASEIDGRRVVIGSKHFIFDDEQVELAADEKRVIEEKAGQHSLLFLAVDRKLIGLICIDDPVRTEAAKVVAELRSLGITQVVMLTGDSEQAAQSLARAINADDYRSQLLPGDKVEYIKDLYRQGKKVIMIGDGINDSPALSAANVGIAMKNGADIAREIADITLTGPDLNALVELRRLSMLLIKRIRYNFNFIIGFNSTLMALGIGGIMPPNSSALLHNLSTVAICLNSMQDLLPEAE